ncbi:MAG: hypothetical protein A2283_00635 [Lentisphaerae bacterium RIFOXYA12_FULL_48_11]|nr:MAG: hypothetical protein A2283_00635 [Lentisphaerae bacterium RIFOXYA12_FULL_48_11]
MVILTILDGPGKGMVNEFQQVLVIGRGEGSDMQIENPSLSRKHAMISIHGSTVILEDLNSTNGVIVNGKKVEKAKLKDGEEFTAGDSVFRVNIIAPQDISYTRILKAKR